MPRFYFHLSNSDECFRDDIGRDLTNLAAAHTSSLLKNLEIEACFLEGRWFWLYVRLFEALFHDLKQSLGYPAISFGIRIRL